MKCEQCKERDARVILAGRPLCRLCRVLVVQDLRDPNGCPWCCSRPASTPVTEEDVPDLSLFGIHFGVQPESRQTKVCQECKDKITHG